MLKILLIKHYLLYKIKGNEEESVSLPTLSELFVLRVKRV